MLYFVFHHGLFYPVVGWHSASCVDKCEVSNVGFDKMCSECLLESNRGVTSAVTAAEKNAMSRKRYI